jgi:ubiquinone/menaquinone biosynthesis C-methylase UbiE
VQADATALPFPCGVFDMVLALDVLEHIEQDVAARSELARVCRRVAWLSVPSDRMTLFPPFLTAIAYRRWGHVRPGYARAQVARWGEVYSWNEPAYRALYPVVRVLTWILPPLGRWLIRLAFEYDKRHSEGDRGHYFCRIKR